MRNRRKRINFLKKLLIAIFFMAILLPTILCIILFYKVHSLQKTVELLLSTKASVEQEYTAVTQENAGESVEEEAKTLIEAEVHAEAGSLAETGSLTESDSPAGAEASLEAESLEEEPLMGADSLGGSTAENIEVKRKIYLTFDDGPSENTDEILDILKEYDVKATFFLVKKEEASLDEAYRRIAEEGHSVGLHSSSHVYSQVYDSMESFIIDFTDIQSFVYNKTGVMSYLYRFPGGSSNHVSHVDMGECIAYLKERNVTYFDWNVSMDDAEVLPHTTQQLVDNVMKDIDKSDTIVVLMHDASKRVQTVEALPIIIEKIQAMEDTVLLPITDTTQLVQHREQ